MAQSSSGTVSTGMLTLRYVGAVVSALVATFGALILLSDLFGLWTDDANSLIYANGYVGIVTTAVTTALFSVIAFLLFRQVTKDVAARPEYVNAPVYHFITNGFFAVLAVAFVVVVARLVGILLSSLLLIGTNTDIGALYLADFLPGLLAAGVIGFVGFSAYKIMRGKNFSALMTTALMVLAGALLLAVLITVPIKAHSASASNGSSDMSDYRKYLDDLYDRN